MRGALTLGLSLGITLFFRSHSHCASGGSVLGENGFIPGDRPSAEITLQWGGGGGRNTFAFKKTKKIYLEKSVPHEVITIINHQGTAN